MVIVMHIKLQNNWRPPAAPAKYPELTAALFVGRFSSAWHLDFSRTSENSGVGRFFASDSDCCPDIAWPWVDGFTPQPEDWRAIGFVVIEIPSSDIGIRLDAAATLAALKAMVAEADAAGRSGATMH